MEQLSNNNNNINNNSNNKMSKKKIVKRQNGSYLLFIHTDFCYFPLHSVWELRENFDVPQGYLDLHKRVSVSHLQHTEFEGSFCLTLVTCCVLKDIYNLQLRADFEGCFLLFLLLLLFVCSNMTDEFGRLFLFAVTC